MRSRTRAGGWLVGLTALLVAVVLGSAAVGPVRIAPAAVVAATANALAVPASLGFAVERVAVAGTTVPLPAARVGFAAPFRFPVPARHAFIVTRIRLPRIVLAAVVGFALASAGAVMQGFFRNPMADPSIVGVSSGAAVGAVAVIVAPLSLPFGVPGAAFVGALLAAFAVYLIATQGGRTPVATLLLSGLAVQSLLGAVVSFLIVGSDDRGLREAVFWLMGSLRNSGWDEVALTLPVALACFAVLAAHARDLNVMLLGETDAVTLGVELERTKRVLLAVASVITGAAVAFVGVVGFVGLVVPHVMRLLVGPDHRLLLPASALAGGAFLVAADTVARSALGGTELPVGVVTAFVGAPFFLYLLRSREVHSL